MAAVKISSIIHCSSESEEFPAKNLLRSESHKQKWQCMPGEKQAFVILQLEKPVRLYSVDIGNSGSAFLEILGGVSTSDDDDEFTVLVQTVGLMTPIESRQETNTSCVRFYTREKMTAAGADGKWDRLKIVCKQPFNSHVGFGLAFIRVTSVEEVDNQSGVAADIGKFKLKTTGESDKKSFSPGSLFAKRSDSAENDSIKHMLQIKSPVDCTSVKPTKQESLKIAKRETKTRAELAENVDEKKRKIASADINAQSIKKDKKSSDKRDHQSSSEDPRPAKQEANRSTKKGAEDSGSSKPFNKLLSDVVFVLSGFQNPLRANLRQQAMDMGARYEPDWKAGCTHLICAFANTPKYNQVKGKGKIVTQDWILDSFKQRKRLPLDKYNWEAVGDKSDDEIELISDTTAAASTKPNTSENRPSTSKTDLQKKAVVEDDDIYNIPTDDSDVSGDTDDEIQRVKGSKAEPSTSTKPKDDEDLPNLPTFFDRMNFLLYGAFVDNERRQLERHVNTFGGVVEQYMRPSITHVLTNEEWDSSFDEALVEFPNLVFLRPRFITDCCRSKKRLDMAPYKVEKQ